jgi:hypothetical protein
MGFNFGNFLGDVGKGLLGVSTGGLSEAVPGLSNFNGGQGLGGTALGDALTGHAAYAPGGQYGGQPGYATKAANQMGSLGMMTNAYDASQGAAAQDTLSQLGQGYGNQAITAGQNAQTGMLLGGGMGGQQIINAAQAAQQNANAQGGALASTAAGAGSQLATTAANAGQNLANAANTTGTNIYNTANTAGGTVLNESAAMGSNLANTAANAGGSLARTAYGAGAGLQSGLTNTGFQLGTTAQQQGQGAAQNLNALGAGQAGQFSEMGNALYGQAAPTVNRPSLSPLAQMQGQQANATGLLGQAAAGNGPSAAQGVLRQGLDEALLNQEAAANSVRGNFGAANAQKNAAMVGGQMGQQAANQAAILRAQEMQAAQAQYAQAANAGVGANTGAFAAQGNFGLGVGNLQEQQRALNTNALLNASEFGAGQQANLAQGAVNAQQGYNLAAMGTEANLAGQGAGLNANLIGQGLGLQGNLVGQGLGLQGSLAGQGIGAQTSLLGQGIGAQTSLANTGLGLQGNLTGQGLGLQGNLVGQGLGMQAGLVGQGLNMGLSGTEAGVNTALNAANAGYGLGLQGMGMGIGAGLQGTQAGTQAGLAYNTLGQGTQLGYGQLGNSILGAQLGADVANQQNMNAAYAGNAGRTSGFINSLIGAAGGGLSAGLKGNPGVLA